MVNDLVSYNRILKVAESQGLSPDTIQQLKNLRTSVQESKDGDRREKRPPCPDGAICIRQAAEKYGIPKTTIQGWVARDYIPIIDHENRRAKYIQESRVKQLADVYSNAGRGSWAVKKFIESETA